MENEEIEHHIQELILKGHIKLNSSPCGGPIVIVQKKYIHGEFVLIIEP
jgi:hypothetical protein